MGMMRMRLWGGWMIKWGEGMDEMDERWGGRVLELV